MSTVEIRVSYLGPLRQQMNCREENLSLEPPVTVRSVLNHLIQRHGEHLKDVFFNAQGWLDPRVMFMVDGGRPHAKQGLEMELSGREEIQIFLGLPMAGG